MSSKKPVGSTIRIKLKPQNRSQQKKPLNVLGQSLSPLPSLGQKHFPQLYEQKVEGHERHESQYESKNEKYLKMISQKEQQNMEANSFLFNKLIEKMEKRESKFFKAEKKLSEINDNISKLVGILMSKWEKPQIDEVKSEVMGVTKNISMKQKQEKIIQNQEQQIPLDKKQIHKEQNPSQMNLDWETTTFQSRLKNISVKPPPSTSTQSQVMVWVGQVCKRVLSAGFKLYQNGELDINKSKAFCSENILRNLISLPKKLKQKYWQAIDTCLKTELFPYYRFNYPQTEEKGVSSKLSNLLIQRDTFNENENDMCLKSGVDFKLEQDQNYNSQIMQFLNFIIKLPSLPPGLKQDNQNQNNSNSLAKLYKRDMEKIFEFVQSEKNLLGIEEFNPKDEKKMGQISVVESYIKQNLMLTKQKNQEKDMELKFKEDEGEKKDPDKIKKLLQYKQKVRSYTSKEIGQKLSENFGTFSENEIQSGNLKLNNSALMRVVTKWCSQLEKCFDSKEIFNRENPWKMKDGSENYLKKSEMIVLNLLLQRQKDKINEKMNQIRKNSIENQIQFSDKQVSAQLKKFSEQQAIVGQFCSSVFKINESYLIKYLNMLIHGLNLALTDFEKAQRVKLQRYYLYDNFVTEEVYPLTQNLIKNLSKDIQNHLNQLQNKNLNLSQTPQLIGFRIGDLLRCKCTSKQSEITALYKLLEYLSHNKPQLIKILKVRNKLDQGNKDILINILYRESMVVEMQLAIKSDKSKFIECSNQFNHYFYELERSQFGPIMEMCSIWTSQDQRSKFYINKTNLNNKRRKQMKSKQCCIRAQNLQLMSLPFKCQVCSYFYYDYNFYQKHSKCKQCHNLICCLCIFHESDTKHRQQIFPVLKEDEKLMSENETICTNFPMNGGKLLNISSKEMKIKSFKPIIYDKEFHLFIQNEVTKQWQVIEKFKLAQKSNSEEEHQKQFKKWYEVFTISNLVFHSSQAEQKYKQLDYQLAQKQYFIPRYFEQINKSQKKSAALIKKYLTSEIFSSVSGEMRSVEKINFSQNFLSSIKGVSKKLPKTKWAMFKSNSISKISAQDINEWSQNLTHLFLNQNYLKDISGIAKLKKLVELNLSKNDIVQITQQVFSTLNQLKVLDMRQNKIKKIPISLCNLSNLIELNISHNNIPQLPQQFGNLVNLKKLYISKLRRYPSQIEKLINLVELDISHVKFAQLPPEFFYLTNLQKVNFQRCKISKLSSQFGKLTKIKILDLGYNLLKQLPEQFCNLLSLQVLNIYDNNLTSLPQSFGNLHSLKKLKINNNSIQELPLQFGNLQNLIQMKIFCNKLKSLPESFGNLKSLESLQIYTNQLENFPNSFGGLVSLANLNATNNQLSMLPESFSELKNLKTLQISSNKFTHIPQQILKIHGLKKLGMAFNKLTTLPEHIRNLQNLQILSLSINEITQLPNSLCQLQSLMQLQISGNRISHFPDEFGNLRNLQQLLCSSNEVEYIPKSFCKLQKIRYINFARNKLTQLCPQFGDLKLINLRIQQNNFKQLPECMMKIKSIEYLNIWVQRCERIPEALLGWDHLGSLQLGSNNPRESDLVKQIKQICDKRQINFIYRQE